MVPHRALRTPSEEFRAVLMVILASGIGMILLAACIGPKTAGIVSPRSAASRGGYSNLTLLPVTYALFAAGGASGGLNGGGSIYNEMKGRNSHSVGCEMKEVFINLPVK